MKASRLPLAIALLAALVLPPVLHAATTYTEIVNGIKWTYTCVAVYGAGYASVGVGYPSPSSAVSTLTSGAITIPSTLGGYPVTSIGEWAFQNCSGLTSVKIPDSVTSIGGEAFQNCSGLTSVKIPDSVTSIGYSAFSGCHSALYNKTSIPGVELVDGWAVDCEKSLSGDLDLTGCRGIGVSAFLGCSGLTSVTIPDSVMSIGDAAFQNCSGLTSVTIGNGVASIGVYAFDGCRGLTSVTIGNGVASIGAYAFLDCSGLTSVTIGNSVMSIGDDAFLDCSGLTSVTIPDSVTSIGRSAFSGCSGLKTLRLPEWFKGKTWNMGIPSGCEVIFYSGGTPYVVTFRANGGKGFMAAQTILRDASTPLSANDFTLAGHAFAGWALSASGAVVYADRATIRNLAAAGGSVTLYAKWAANPPQSPPSPSPPPTPTTYQIVFEANGGTGVMAAQAIAANTMVALRANAFTKSGSVFLGWSATATGPVAFADKTSVKNLAAASGNVTLYAQWAVKKYKVKYNKNGGKLPKGKKMATQTMSYGKASKLRKNVFKAPKGKVFAGWAVSKANAKKGVIAYRNAQSVKDLRTDGKTTTLYAVWAKKTYAVKFYANGGKGKMAAQAMTYGKAKKLTANKFKRKGYAFKGWAKSKALAKKGKVAYKNKKAVKNLVITGKTVKLYAVWKKK